MIVWGTSNFLQDAFYKELNEAKSCVEEPPQTKIKLRAPSTQTPGPSSAKPKRITIHVGGGREDSQGSPAPQAGTPGFPVGPNDMGGDSSRPPPVNATLANLGQGPGALSTPASAVKREDPARQSPAIPPQLSNGYSSSAFRPVMPPVNGYGQPPHPAMPNGHAPPLVLEPPRPLYDIKYRGGGTSKLGTPGYQRTHANFAKDVKDAILKNLCIRTPLDNNPDRRFVFNVPAHPKLLQQSFTIVLGPTQWKLQIVPRISSALEEQQRPYKLFIMINGVVLGRGTPNPRDPIQPDELLYDASLHQGVNTIKIQMIAALPKGETLPNGSDAVLETITIMANVMRQ